MDYEQTPLERSRSGMVIDVAVPQSPLRSDFVWLDVEASSLSRSSFPVEIGLSNDVLEGRSILVRPHDDWDEWSATAQDIHGLERKDLRAHGRDIVEVCEILNGVLAGKHVFADTVDADGPDLGFDAAWLNRLFRSAGIKRTFVLQNEMGAIVSELRRQDPEFDIDMARMRLNEAEMIAEKVFPHTHRGAQDARSRAAVFRMTCDHQAAFAYEFALGSSCLDR